MKKWKFDDKSLKKMYKEEKVHLKISYKEFKKWAEQFANELIEDAKKKVENEKEMHKM